MIYRTSVILPVRLILNKLKHISRLLQRYLYTRALYASGCCKVIDPTKKPLPNT